VGNHGRIDETQAVLEVYYAGWSISHKTAIVALFVLMVFHLALHWDR